MSGRETRARTMRGEIASVEFGVSDTTGIDKVSTSQVETTERHGRRRGVVAMNFRKAVITMNTLFLVRVDIRVHRQLPTRAHAM